MRERTKLLAALIAIGARRSRLAVRAAPGSQKLLVSPACASRRAAARPAFSLTPQA